MSADGFRLGVEYFDANDFSAALVDCRHHGRQGPRHFGFRLLIYVPAGICRVRPLRHQSTPTTRPRPPSTTSYYTLGVSWSPVKIVDSLLAYKHEDVAGGTFSGSNGAIGSTTGLMKGAYNEVGMFGDLQW